MQRLYNQTDRAGPSRGSLRGVAAVRYKGQFYVEAIDYEASPFFCHWIVADVPTGQGIAYKRWLLQQRARYQTVQDKYDKAVPKTWLAEVTHGILEIAWFPGRFRACLPQQLYRGLPLLVSLPSSRLPHRALEIDWVYTIDLDQELFSVNNRYHFRLSAIPRSWWLIVEELQRAEDEDPRVMSTLEYLTGIFNPDHGLVLSSKRSDNPPLPPMLTRGILQWSLVRPKSLGAFKSGKRSFIRFASRIFHAMTNTSDGSINIRWNYLSLQNSSHVGVREAMFGILCLASDNRDYFELVRLRLQSERPDERVDAGIFCIDEQSGECELISRLGTSARHEGKCAFTAPDSSLYWFNNALICIWDNLESDSEAETSIKYVTEAAANEGVDCFYAIIMSISHVIVLQMLPGRHIKRSWRLRLVDLDRSMTTSPKEMMLSEPKRPPPCSNYSAFSAIAHLLEAAQRQKCVITPTGPGRAYFLLNISGHRIPFGPSNRALPLEVELQIIKHANRLTRRNISASCRDLRDACQEYGTFSDTEDIVDEDERVYFKTDIHGSHNLRRGPASMTNFENSELLMFAHNSFVPVVGHISRTRSFVPEAIVVR